jgi:aminopeptidase-like protein
MLNGLRMDGGAIAEIQELWPLMEALFPVCRSITGNGVRRSFDMIQTHIPLERTEVASGTTVFDWEIPAEWNIRDAYVADANGRRLIDFQAHNLHVVGYSVPVRSTMTFDELQPHLYSLPEQPDRIPYRTSYYHKTWGFCLKHTELLKFGHGPFEVVIDSTLAPGALSYAECTVEGTSNAEALVYTHTCHPSLANDNLTGILVSVALARQLLRDKPRLTWRFIFGPGTIGSLSWLAQNEGRLERVETGLTIGLLGDPGHLTYKRSRRGDCVTDRAATFVLESLATDARILDFEPYGYDERQFCSPGFNLPVGRLTRSPNGQYPEYHSSADDLTLVRPAQLGKSLQVLAELIAVLDRNRTMESLLQKGEPMLGKRGLYGSLGGSAPPALQQAMLWVMNYSDGTHDLLWIAVRSGLPFDVIVSAAEALHGAGLLMASDGRHTMSKPGVRE